MGSKHKQHKPQMNTKQQTTIAIIMVMSLIASTSTEGLRSLTRQLEFDEPSLMETPCIGMQVRNAEGQCGCQHDQYEPGTPYYPGSKQLGPGICKCVKPWMTTDPSQNFKCIPIPNWCGVNTYLDDITGECKCANIHHTHDPGFRVCYSCGDASPNPRCGQPCSSRPLMSLNYKSNTCECDVGAKIDPSINECVCKFEEGYDYDPETRSCYYVKEKGNKAAK